MVSAGQLRQLALGLPETEEKSHFAQPDFRVRNKIFAGLDRAQKVGNLKLTPEAQAMLLEARPSAFYPAAGAWGRSGWTHVVLAQVELSELRDLVIESFRLVAPKTLGASLHLSTAPANAPDDKKDAAKKLRRKGDRA